MSSIILHTFPDVVLEVARKHFADKYVVAVHRADYAQVMDYVVKTISRLTGGSRDVIREKYVMSEILFLECRTRGEGMEILKQLPIDYAPNAVLFGIEDGEFSRITDNLSSDLQEIRGVRSVA